jgi:hypothetical protein
LTPQVCRHGLRVAIGILAGLAFVLAETSSAFAAAPRIIIVAGGGLAKPVVLDDWHENLAIMLAATDGVDARIESLSARPWYRIAMFWGQRWEQYMQAGNDPRALHIEEADQLARYYPPTAAHAAVLSFDGISGPGAFARRLKAPGVSIFSRHDIGAHTPPAEGVPPWMLVVLSGAAGTVGVVLSLRMVRRKRRATRLPLG